MYVERSSESFRCMPEPCRKRSIGAMSLSNSDHEASDRLMSQCRGQGSSAKATGKLQKLTSILDSPHNGNARLNALQGLTGFHKVWGTTDRRV